MQKFAHSIFGKSIIITIAIIIAAALVTSAMCTGPIDDIFPGWRDESNCKSYDFICFFNGVYEKQDTSSFVILVLFLLILAILIKLSFVIRNKLSKK